METLYDDFISMSSRNFNIFIGKINARFYGFKLNRGIVKAMDLEQAKVVIEEWDIVLLGPQVRYLLKGIQDLTDKPVVVINPADYVMDKGETTVKTALELLKK